MNKLWIFLGGCLTGVLGVFTVAVASESHADRALGEPREEENPETEERAVRLEDVEAE
jgi:hypothetical protein